MTAMRAKMRINSVKKNEDAEGKTTQETLSFSCVAASNYPEDGSDENNTFAKLSPSGSLSLTVANPALFGKFDEGEEYYLDFTRAEVAPKAESA